MFYWIIGSTREFQRLRRIKQSGCYTVYLREFFIGAGAQQARFREMDVGIIESELRTRLELRETDILAMIAQYKFSNPKVYINFCGTTKDFVEIYKSDIYNSLLDSLPMVYFHPDLRLKK